MRRTLLNDGWIVRRKANPFEERLGMGDPGTPVTLPHDALRDEPRSPAGSPATAFYPGGAWEYERQVDGVGGNGASVVVLEFEGVYRDALVSVNENVVVHRPNGYVGFTVQIDHLLRPDGPNVVKVEARTHEDSRWYTGAGIYRNVWLLESGRVHLGPDGVQVLTAEVDDDVAVVTVHAHVQNQSTALSRAALRVALVDPEGSVVTETESPVTTFPGESVTARQRLTVAGPRRWGPDHPALYVCRVSLVDGEQELDHEVTTFGIRTLSLDPLRGFRVNGEAVLLRGACVHHDNGPLGAATIDRAEERRAELLKGAGFNAIRSAHNPMSRAMLDACDRLGLFVMDEAFDMWEQPKSEHDYALRFADWWAADIEAMVRKDINHPCVILYSIGNEIPEAGKPQGIRRGRALAERVRMLDDSRFVTEAVSGMLIGGAEIFDEIRARFASTEESAGNELGPNTAMSTLADMMNQLMRAPSVGTHSVEPFAYLDVAGYNYMESRYEMDGQQHPNRVIVGSETHPVAIDKGWAGVLRYPHVIGDFTWTGWDYLGEVGIGRVVYGGAGPMAAFMGAFPWRTAWCGDIDITGHRRPQSYYREIVFGLRSDPYVAVQPPQHHGRKAASTPWSWTDVVSNWSWDGHEGEPITAEVYADADEVELLVNGRSVGTQPAGVAHAFRASFETVYEPGVLEAVARRGGRESGRASIVSAKGSVGLAVEVDRSRIEASAGDLAYVSVALVDDQGVLRHAADDRRVEVAVDGPGILQALSSANPSTEEGFGEAGCSTFDGRALAVVRPTASGRITVTVRADGCEPRQVAIEARDPADPR